MLGEIQIHIFSNILQKVGIQLQIWRITKLLRKNTKPNARTLKIAEALLIKEIEPILNKQDDSGELKLFN